MFVQHLLKSRTPTRFFGFLMGRAHAFGWRGVLTDFTKTEGFRIGF